jgi:hypothetical protein
MKIKTLSLIGISTLFVFTACTKDDDSTGTTSSTSTTGGASNAGVVGTWKVTEMTTTVNMGGKDTTIDMLADQEECEKDNLLKFNDDYTILELSGAMKCDSTDVDSEPGGVWALLNNNTQFRIIDGDTTLADVVSLTNTTFKIKYQESSLLNITLTKQ